MLTAAIITGYQYTADLLHLQAFVNLSPPPLPPYITKSLHLEAWRYACNTILTSNWYSTSSPAQFRGSALDFTCFHLCQIQSFLHISRNLESEIAKGFLIEPLPPSFIHISSQGAIPKKHSEKWHLIPDLSNPAHPRVNDGIEKPTCSITNMRIDEVVHKIFSLGRACRLVKIDIKSAFQNVPEHLQDRHLFSMSWKGNLSIDPVLPFGLRSAPKIFNALADALQWMAG